MPRTVQQLTVFVAWPGDAGAERDRVFKVVGRIDRTLGKQHGVRVEAVDWKTVARPGQGRPQDRINEAVKGYDIWVGVLNLSIGSEAGKGLTGFEEEFALADEAWRTGKKKGKGPSLLLYFRSRVTVNTDSLKPEQIARVQAFKQERIKRRTLMFGSYTSLADFEEQIHEALYDEVAARIGKMVGGRPAAAAQAPASEPVKATTTTTRTRKPKAAAETPGRKKPTRGPKALRIDTAPKVLTAEAREAYARRVLNSLHLSLSRTVAAFRRGHEHATLTTTKAGSDAFEIKGQAEGYATAHFRVVMEKDRWNETWQIHLQQAQGTGFSGEPYFYTVATVRTADDDHVSRLEDSRNVFGRVGAEPLTARDVAESFWRPINDVLKNRR